MQSEVQKLKLSARQSENTLLTDTLGIPVNVERPAREYSQWWIMFKTVPFRQLILNPRFSEIQTRPWLLLLKISQSKSRLQSVFTVFISVHFNKCLATFYIFNINLISLQQSIAFSLLYIIYLATEVNYSIFIVNNAYHLYHLFWKDINWLEKNRSVFTFCIVQSRGQHIQDFISTVLWGYERF